MRLTRKTRLTAALLALVSMLFMQLAVAAYVCPGLQMGDQGAVMLSQSQSQPDSGSMPGCDQPDPKQPALCHAHCQDGKQSLDKAELPPILSALASGFFTAVVNSDILQRPFSTSVPLLTRTTAPPLSIRNCCFRI